MHNFLAFHSQRKAFGQQFGESKFFLLKNVTLFVGSGTNDSEVRLAEFPHHLSANAARSADVRPFAVGRSTSDGYCAEVFAVFAQSLCESYAFSAQGGRESSILYVATLEHPAVRAEQCSTNAETGIRRISMPPSLQSFIYQF